MVKNLKWLLIGLVAFTGVLAAPASAQTQIYEYELVFPPVAQYCYTLGGHWMWDGVQYEWVPSTTICEYR